MSISLINKYQYNRTTKVLSKWVTHKKMEEIAPDAANSTREN